MQYRISDNEQREAGTDPVDTEMVLTIIAVWALLIGAAVLLLPGSW